MILADWEFEEIISSSQNGNGRPSYSSIISNTYNSNDATSLETVKTTRTSTPRGGNITAKQFLSYYEYDSGDVKVYEPIQLTKYPNEPNCHPSQSTKVQKLYILRNNAEQEPSSEMRHIVKDGIEKSSRLGITTDANDANAIWIVDYAQLNCKNDVMPVIQKRWNGTSVPWKMIVLDFCDNGAIAADSCFGDIVKAFKSNKYVYYATRSTRKGRYIHLKDSSENQTFHTLGKDVDFSKELLYKQDQDPFQLHHCSVQPLKYGVRSDLVHAIENVVHEKDVVGRSRPKDGAHFWDIDGDLITGKLRTEVSMAMRSFASEHEHSKYTMTTEKVGARYAAGRNSVDKMYAIELVSHKIVVVCQRDMWQGHYRLMEALAGGAMVLTDPMYPLPYGIEDGKQVVVYDSIWKLKYYLNYYLENSEERMKIARSGYNVAMNYHRSWHLMERLVFGNWDRVYGV